MMVCGPMHCGREILPPERCIRPKDTERLGFSVLTDQYFGVVHAYASDPEVCRYMEWGPNTPDDTRNYLDRCNASIVAEPRVNYTFGFSREEDEQWRLIGVCSITIADASNKQARIGYVLRRDAWRNGYATEAAKALLDFGFHRLGMHRIWAVCRPENTGSANVLRKIGMEHEGRLRHDKFYRGQWHDSLLFAVVDE